VRLQRGLISVSAVVVILGLLCGLSDSAYSQDLQGWVNWGTVGGGEDIESKTPPLNLQGCWTGTEEDQGGEGQMFINFSQHGRTITKSSSAGIAFSTGQGATGPVSGSVNSKSFQVGFHHKSCNISFTGKLPNGGPDLVGRFNFNCKPTGIKRNFKGTFDLVSDPGGCP
jgi:hypothetical protein